MRSFSLTVPASSGNLGAGFDCFGLALSMYNRFYIEWAEDYAIHYTRPHSKDMLIKEKNRVILNYLWACKRIGGKPIPFRLRCDNVIPLAAGLGSSGTAALTGCATALLRSGEHYDTQQLLELVWACEGHPDNVAASLYGGFVICYEDSAGKTWAHKLPVSAKLCCWILRPTLTTYTSDARRKLSAAIPRKDLVFNLGHGALTAVAFATGDYSLLKTAVYDRVHEHQRDESELGYDALKEALMPTEIFSVSLSGSGPAILVLAPRITEAQRQLVAAHFARLGVGWQEHILSMDNQGMRFQEDQ